MPTAYCETCGGIRPCRILDAHEEAVCVRGAVVTVLQKHAHCAYCGEEVTPNEIIDFNVFHAHDAYRKSVGAMVSGEIRGILRQSSMSAVELSRLLGWEENAVDCLLKRRVSTKEQTRRLREMAKRLNRREVNDGQGKNYAIGADSAL